MKRVDKPYLPDSLKTDKPVDKSNVMLTELREQWEHGGTVEFHRMEEHWALTILSHHDEGWDGENYTCLRYFTVGGKWQVSADHQECNLQTAFVWLDRQAY